jgi:MAF protein
VADAAPDEVVLGADTLVVADGATLGKPSTATEARAMLEQLRGRPHTVITGVALRANAGREWGAAVSTLVHMRGYADTEVERYVERGEPFDKAGGYAVQDAEFRPVERLEGCYLNVVGLPLCAVARGLEALGKRVQGPRECVPPCDYCRAGSAYYRFSPW